MIRRRSSARWSTSDMGVSPGVAVAMGSAVSPSPCAIRVKAGVQERELSGADPSCAGALPTVASEPAVFRGLMAVRNAAATQ